LFNSLKQLLVPADAEDSSGLSYQGVTLAPAHLLAVERCLADSQATYDKGYVQEYVEGSPLLKATRPDRSDYLMFDLNYIFKSRAELERQACLRR